MNGRPQGFNLNTVAIIVSLCATLVMGAVGVVKITHTITQAEDVLNARLDRQEQVTRDDRATSKGATDDLKRQLDLLRYEMGEVKLALAQAGIYFSDQGNHVTVRRRR